MIKLRANQIKAVEVGVDFFTDPKKRPNSLIIAPTAFGKSIIIAEIIKRTGRKVISLQPSKELLIQNYNKYILNGGEASIYSASAGKKELGDVVFATIGSVYRLHEFKGYDVIVDEAHLFPRAATSMFGAFMRNNKVSRVLGLTATPLRLQTNTDRDGWRFSKLVMLTTRNKDGTFYKEIIHCAQISEMVELGFWSKLLYHCIKQEYNVLKLNTSASEYTEESVEENYQKNSMRGKITDLILEHQDRRKILVFVHSVDEARYLSSITEFSAAIWGEMPAKQRDSTIEQFKNGSLRIIFNVNVLGVGFDYDMIDMIIIGRNTMSLAWYYQVVGRGTRINPNKDNCKVVDLCGIVDKFGKVEDFKYEEIGGKWELTSNGKVLTSVPITAIGSVTVEQKNSKVMPYGKYKDVALEDIPEGYLRWCLSNFDWTGKEILKKNMEFILENKK